MIETSPSARHRAAFNAAHKARAAAFGDLTRRIFHPSRANSAD